MSVISVTQENFSQLSMDDKPLLLDFYADWCGPCKLLSPIIHEIAQERSDLNVGKVNVDEQMALAMEYGVASIPTVVLIHKGELIGKHVGYLPMEDLLDELNL